MLNNNKVIPERVREARISRDLTTTQLAESLEITRQCISQYELGHSEPTHSILRKMVEVLEFPVAFFYKPLPQTNNLESISFYSPTFFRSLKAARKSGKNKVTIRTDWLEEIYLYLNQYVDFPVVNVPDMSKYLTGKELSQDEIEDIAEYVRKNWGLGIGPISNILLLLEKNGFVIARNSIKDKKIDAFSQWKGETPYIYLSSDKDCAVRTRFDASHELGHLLLHIDSDQHNYDDEKYIKTIEQEANKFASAFLLPRDSFGQEVMSTSLDHFINLKRRWKVSIQAMIYRCSDLGILNENQILYLRKQISIRKMRTNEPLDDELIPESPVMLKQAVEIILEENSLNNEKIVDELCLPIEEIEALTNLPKGTLSLSGHVIPLKLKNHRS
ncbi:Zn-dependent peptidase ImmA (M78 family) [Ruminiclostridium sufflavum DSM 19573]|uniref:Zn-dependent peptidase ImmA (M78 family) n=1 Tax=Ruminiclostridium sufflavum DSM 19573 TaxID=1121337 RepID=A0A318XTF4_9FIRM|nr:XRE family transcriptional regulator [Ruminiclostridium sufflavum]PYG90123.1 Zn-dependent peptidase ImmA (M78 family) [Ruminiclostridium sufflavum DSM 19573]